MIYRILSITLDWLYYTDMASDVSDVNGITCIFNTYISHSYIHMYTDTYIHTHAYTYRTPLMSTEQSTH